LRSWGAERSKQGTLKCDVSSRRAFKGKKAVGRMAQAGMEEKKTAARTQSGEEREEEEEETHSRRRL